MYYPPGMIFPNHSPLDNNGQQLENQGEPAESDNRDEFHNSPEETTNDEGDEKEPDEKRPRIEHNEV